MYKALKDNKIIAVNESGKFPCLIYDEVVEDVEHHVEDYQQYNGEFVLDLPIEEKQARVRVVRNQYLADTDIYMIADFPITEEQRNQYKAYRQYLRDYTAQDNWWEENPLSFEDWKQGQAVLLAEE